MWNMKFETQKWRVEFWLVVTKGGVNVEVSQSLQICSDNITLNN